MLGNAKDFAKYFSHGADEIYCKDVATLYGTNNLIKFVNQSYGMFLFLYQLEEVLEV